MWMAALLEVGHQNRTKAINEEAKELEEAYDRDDAGRSTEEAEDEERVA